MFEKGRMGGRVTLPDTETYFKAINIKQCNTLIGINMWTKETIERREQTHTCVPGNLKTKVVSQINTETMNYWVWESKLIIRGKIKIDCLIYT